MPKLNLSFGTESHPLVSKLALAKISEDLMTDPACRTKFIHDPNKYITDKYGHALSANDAKFFENLKEMLADGFCCSGCGCRPAFGNERVINPTL